MPGATMRPSLLPLAFALACTTAPTPDAVTAQQVVDAVPTGTTLTATLAADGLTVQVDLRADPQRRAWVLTGRSLRPLTGVTAFTASGLLLDATVTGPRAFEVLLTRADQGRALLGGEPLLLAVETPGVLQYARVTLAPAATTLVGAPDATVSPLLAPFYARATTPLRWRATVSTSTPVDEVTVSAPVGAPNVTDLTATTWGVDWTLGWLGAAFVRPGTPTVFTIASGGSTVDIATRLGMAVTSLSLTDEDPTVVWPTPTCDDAVATCIGDDPGGPDLAGCGSYLEVATCVDARACLLDGFDDLDLSDTDPSALVPATEAWDAACRNGGTWCTQAEPTTWEVGACLAPADDLEAIWTELSFLDQDLAGMPWAWGQTWVGRAALANVYPFTTSYSTGGPALLDALTAWGGGDDVQAWIGTSEIPCPNCHDFLDKVVLWWPSTGKVVVLTGTHGYDS